MLEAVYPTNQPCSALYYFVTDVDSRAYTVTDALLQYT